MIRSPDPAGPIDAGTLPRRPCRRASDRSPARPGVRFRPAEQDLLPLSGRRGSLARAVSGRPPAGLPRGLDPLLADPSGCPAGAALGAARDRARAAGAGDRPRPDRGQPGQGGGDGLAAGLPGGRPRLLCALRLFGRPRQHRHAGRKPGAAAVPHARRRGLAGRGRGAATPRRRARRAAAP